MTSERIEISLDDLDGPSRAAGDGGPPPPATPGAPSDPTLPASRALPPLTPGPAPVTVNAAAEGSPSIVTRLGANPVVSGLTVGVIAGVVGALLGWWVNHSIIQEPLFENAVLALIVSPLVGLLLAGWPDLSAGAYGSAVRRGLVGAAVGLVAALIAVAIADPIFDSLRYDEFGDLTDDVTTLRGALWLAWVILGTLVGLGLGITGGWRKMINGALGGCIGGALGGVIYVLLAPEGALLLEPDDPFRTSLGPQVLAAVLTATSVCLAIGIVERTRRQVWLRVIRGPLSGKEYILYRDVTVIGSDSRCDVVLAKDATVAPRHLRIERTANRTSFAAEGAPEVTINDQPCRNGTLRSGDVIGLGAFALTYEER